jgi:hypothetical protein
MESHTGAELRELLLSFIGRVTVSEQEVRIEIHRCALMMELGISSSASHKDISDSSHAAQTEGVGTRRQSATSDVLAVNIPTSLRRRGVETKLIINAPGEAQKPSAPDPTLIKLLANAHKWWDDLTNGRFPTTRALAQAYGKDERYVARVLPLAFLAPSIVDAIATGGQPIELTTQRFVTLHDLPHDWNRQVAEFGFSGI